MSFMCAREREAARRGGGGLVAPVQRVTDFIDMVASKESSNFPTSSYRSDFASFTGMSRKFAGCAFVADTPCAGLVSSPDLCTIFTPTSLRHPSEEPSLNLTGDFFIPRTWKAFSLSFFLTCL